ncbi:MAG: hypothetical protein CVU45_06850 [Chloroflexi bacterium HGW-Chloroflexi-7]|nr:MAG: hypothetical protein CVU45_06850 [Chloroflexi bacterium HGW-Chloroflexi-7]
MRIALTLQMTLPGAPMIYYGDEVGMLGETDPDCRSCMLWDETLWNHQILQFTRAIIHLRHEHPALRNGSLTQLAFFNGVYAYKQQLADDEVIVIVNPRESISKFEIPTGSQHEKWIDYANCQTFTATDGRLFIDSLPAGSALVLTKSI